jgi:hypothetical protein
LETPGLISFAETVCGFREEKPSSGTPALLKNRGIVADPRTDTDANPRPGDRLTPASALYPPDVAPPCSSIYAYRLGPVEQGDL